MRMYHCLYKEWCQFQLGLLLQMSIKDSHYGLLSGFITAALLQPLQNIKMALMIPPKDTHFTNNFLRNLWSACIYLYKDNKIPSFYRGLIPCMMKTGFSNAIYFTTLRWCQRNDISFSENRLAKPFINSLIARIACVTISNPLQVLETRYQYAGKERWAGNIFTNFVKIYQEEGMKGMFKGSMATWYKEGIFAGLYYTLYQQGKRLQINNFAAGLLSGVIATSITHPFEIIRAQYQSSIITNNAVSRLNIAQQVQVLAKSGQLFKGLAPRILKKPMSNTLAIVIFQTCEAFQKKSRS